MEENLNQDAEFLERVLKRMPTLFFFNGHRNDAIAECFNFLII